MKERLGWVSNSSSSSFILAYKEEDFKDDKELVKYIEDLPLFKIPKENAIYAEFSKVPKLIVFGGEDKKVFKSKEELIKHSMGEEYCEDELEIFNKGFDTMINGSIDNVFDGFNEFVLLYGMDFYYEDDKIYLFKQESEW